MIFSSFSDALDERLECGGCQIERYELCSICGDDVYDDGVEIDGDWYCNHCFRKHVNSLYKKIENVFDLSKISRLDEVALITALQEYSDDNLNA